MNFGKALGRDPVSAAFSAEDIEDLAAMFAHYDVEHSKSITGANVLHILYMLGYIVDSNAVSVSRLYSFTDFLQLSAQLVAREEITPIEKKRATKLFQMVDVVGHGTVDAIMLHKFLVSCGERYTLEQTKALVAAIDRSDLENEAMVFGASDLHEFLEKYAPAGERGRRRSQVSQDWSDHGEGDAEADGDADGHPASDAEELDEEGASFVGGHSGIGDGGLSAVASVADADIGADGDNISDET